MKVIKSEKEVAKVFVEDGDIMEIYTKTGHFLYHLMIVRIAETDAVEFGAINLEKNLLLHIRRSCPIDVYKYYADRYSVKILHKDRVSVVIDHKEEAK